MNHFEGKDALAHVLEKRLEPHGKEMPDHMSLGIDSARILMTFLLILSTLSFNHPFLFAIGALIALAGRRAWLAWTHLERLHRLLQQEKYEIEHHREQEREELRALYGAKGFEGKLLEQVVDVLMADDNRLLQVMLEEEMKLNLQAYEHPLKQALGVVGGCILAILVFFIASLVLPSVGVMILGLIFIGIMGGFAAYLEKNHIIAGAIWNLGIAALSLGVIYFLYQLVISNV